MAEVRLKHHPQLHHKRHQQTLLPHPITDKSIIHSAMPTRYFQLHTIGYCSSQHAEDAPTKKYCHKLPLKIHLILLCTKYKAIPKSLIHTAGPHTTCTISFFFYGHLQTSFTPQHVPSPAMQYASPPVLSSHLTNT